MRRGRGTERLPACLKGTNNNNKINDDYNVIEEGGRNGGRKDGEIDRTNREELGSINQLVEVEEGRVISHSILNKQRREEERERRRRIRETLNTRN